MSKKIITWFLCLTMSLGLMGSSFSGTMPVRGDNDLLTQESTENTGEGEQGDDTDGNDNGEGTDTDGENNGEGTDTDGENNGEETDTDGENNSEGTDTDGENNGEGTDTDGENNGEETGTDGENDGEETGTDGQNDDNSNADENTDKVDGVIVTGENVPEGATVDYSEKASDDVAEIPGYSFRKAYDIKLLDGEGKEVQPTGKVTVTLKDANTTGEQGVVFYVKEGSKPEKMPTTVKGADVEFTTDHFSTYVYAVQETADGTHLLKDIEIYHDNSVLTSESKVSIKDHFTLRYNFKQVGFNVSLITDTDERAKYQEISAGTLYTLPDVDTTIFKIAEDKTIPVKWHGKEMGILKVTTEGKVTFQITYAPDEGEIEKFNDGYVEFSATFNEETLPTTEKVEIHLLAGATVSVTVAENIPDDPEIKKESKLLSSEDGYLIQWTVTIKNARNSKVYEHGFYVEDEITSGQKYVTGTLKVENLLDEEISAKGVEGTTEALSEEGKSASSEILKIYYNNAESNHRIVITYQTKVDEVVLTREACEKEQTSEPVILENKVTNTVTLYAVTEKEEGVVKEITPLNSAEADQSLTKTLEHWIDKEGGALNKDGEASWTVTIRNNGYTVNNVTLHDTFITDGTTEMELVDNKIKYSLNGGAENELVISSEEVLANGWEHNFGTLTGTQVLTITYTTRIKSFEEFLRTNHSTLPGNKAHITFEYPFGDGKGTVQGPTMAKTCTGIVKNAALQKVATGIDVKEHTITWKVTANQSLQPITDVVIAEMPDDRQQIVSISDLYIGVPDKTENIDVAKLDKVAADTLDTLITKDDTNSKWTLNLGDRLQGDGTKGKVAVFTVVTKLKDTEGKVWAGNTAVLSKEAHEYKNTVTLTCEEDKKGTSKHHPVSYTANKVYDGIMLAKESSAFDYKNHTIDYTITVNQNKTKITDVTVVDDLSKLGVGVELVDGKDGVVAEGATVHYENKKLTVSYDEITGEKSIAFRVKVLDNAQLFKENKEFEVKNTAILSSAENNTDGIKNEVKVSVANKFKNVVIDKTGKPDKDKGTATYTVAINNLQQELPGNVFVCDTIGAGFELDIESVKLYEANVKASDGTLEKAGEIALAEDAVTMQRSGKKTVMEVDLPLEDDKKKSFILTYQLKAVDFKSKDFSNFVELCGFGETTANKKNVVIEESAFSDAWMEGAVHGHVEIVDDEGKVIKVEGAIFTVETTTGKKVAEVITDAATGIAKTVGVLKENTEYVVKPDKLPSGVVVKEEQVKKTTGKSGKKNVTVWQFTLATTEVAIHKVDSSTGKELKDAELTLTTKESGKTVDSWTSKTEAHKVTVTYGKEYVLEETMAPSGYKLAEKLTFKVDRAGSDDVYYVNGEKASEILMKDAKEGSKPLEIKIVSEDQKNPLEDVEFTITPTDDKKDKVKPFTGETEGEIFHYDVPYGEYDVTVTEVPKGFKEPEKTTVHIKVTEEGIEVETDHGYEKLPEDKPAITFEPKIDEDVVTDPDAYLIQEEEKDTEKLLPGGEFKVFVDHVEKITPKEIKFEDEKPVTEPVRYQTVYRVEEVKAPEGYETQEKPVYFKIVYEKASGLQPAKNVVYVKQQNGSFVLQADKTVHILYTKKTSSGGDSNGGGGGGGSTTDDTKDDTTEDTDDSDDSGKEEDEDTGKEDDEDTGKEEDEDTGKEDDEDTGKEEDEDTGKEDDEDTGKEDDDSDTEDDDDSEKKPKERDEKDRDRRDSDDDDTPHKKHKKDKEPKDSSDDNGKRRLAQTGGFMGTAMSYGLGLLFIILGCILKIFESNKRKYRK